MTPMHLMTRQTFLGWLFLVVGLLLIGLACSPVVLGLLSTPRVHGDVSIPFLLTGVVVALFGAWLLPSSGAPAAGASMVTVFAPILPSIRLPGRSRADDPKPTPPPSSETPPTEP